MDTTQTEKIINEISLCWVQNIKRAFEKKLEVLGKHFNIAIEQDHKDNIRFLSGKTDAYIDMIHKFELLEARLKEEGRTICP